MNLEGRKHYGPDIIAPFSVTIAPSKHPQTKNNHKDFLKGHEKGSWSSKNKLHRTTDQQIIHPNKKFQTLKILDVTSMSRILRFMECIHYRIASYNIELLSIKKNHTHTKLYSFI